MVKRPPLFFNYAVYAWNKKARQWDHYCYVQWDGVKKELLYNTVRAILSGPAGGFVLVEDQHAVTRPRFEYWRGKNREIEAYTPK